MWVNEAFIYPHEPFIYLKESFQCLKTEKKRQVCLFHLLLTVYHYLRFFDFVNRADSARAVLFG